MGLVKIAICFRDEEYLTRFIKCWMHHFKNDYELYVIDTVEELSNQRNKYEIILVEGIEEEALQSLPGEGRKLFSLSETVHSSECCMVLEKYQELYKIEQQIRLHGVERDTSNRVIHSKQKVVGVFSVDEESYQIPFCAILAQEHKKDSRCVLLNLQTASGLEIKNDLSLEELLVAAETNQYTRTQIQDAIVQENGWDYVSPVRNSQYIVETNKDLYETLFTILGKELGYDTYIINFGQLFKGCMEMMNMCDEFYILVPQKGNKTCRERAFIQELKYLGLDHFMDRMMPIEIPFTYNPYESWRDVAEKWKWNSFAKKLEKM